MIEIVAYDAAHFDGVRDLWETVFPGDPRHNRAEVAIPEKLKTQGELFFVALFNGTVIGTTMAAYDGHRGWLYSVAVHPDHQRGGVGSLLLQAAEAKLVEMGCGKINLQIRAGNDAVAAFYDRHGYTVEERISMGKRFTL